MAWRDDLRKVSFADGEAPGASFRGVPFRTVGADTGVGRRNIIHEYPQRDIPYAQDLGRRAREFRVNGYVVGDDYMQQRDALIVALEEFGPGELVHPRYGTLNVVVVGKIDISESSENGGIARFAITFVESGKNAFPQAAANTQDGVHDAADALGNAAVSQFASKIDLAGAAALATDAISRVTSTINTIKKMVSLNGLVDSAGDIVRGVSSIADDIADLIRTPETLALRMQSLWQDLSVALDRPGAAMADLRALAGDNDSEPDAWNDGSSSSTGSWGGGSTGGLSGGAVGSAVLGTTAAQRMINLAADQAFVRSQCMAAQARILTDSIAVGDILTADDALTYAKRLTDQIDHELEAYDPPIEIAAALIDLRVAVVRDVAEQGDRLLQRSIFTTQSILPALVIAQRIYQDATRADELVARNDVRNPLFVPAGPLEVLR